MRLKEDSKLSAMVKRHSYINEFHYYKTLDSTNAVALSRCESGNALSGTLILSDYQTDGKGRMKNTWESSVAEDILMSLVLKPLCCTNRWAQLSFPLGLAIRQALQHYVPPHVAIELKWPNDILIGQKKSVGMLHTVSASLGMIILGIGINVNQESNENNRSSLKMISGIQLDRWAVLNDVLIAIGMHLDSILSATINADDWNSHAAYIGQHVQVFDQQMIKGRFMGIDHRGAALIQTNEGTVPVLSGSNFRLA